MGRRRCGAAWVAAAGMARRGQQQQEWCGMVWAAGVVQHGHAFEVYFTFVLVSSILYALIFDPVLSNEKWYYRYIRAKGYLGILNVLGI